MQPPSGYGRVSRGPARRRKKAEDRKRLRTRSERPGRKRWREPSCRRSAVVPGEGGAGSHPAADHRRPGLLAPAISAIEDDASRLALRVRPAAPLGRASGTNGQTKMKFSDGHWHIPEHLKVQHPVHVHDVRVEGDEVVADVAALAIQDTPRSGSRHGLHRCRLFAPAEGVIGVRVTHFEGGQPPKPEFAAQPASRAWQVIAQDDTSVTLHSGGLAVTLPKSGPYALNFLRGDKRITGSLYQGWRLCRRSRYRGFPTCSNGSI